MWEDSSDEEEDISSGRIWSFSFSTSMFVFFRRDCQDEWTHRPRGPKAHTLQCLQPFPLPLSNKAQVQAARNAQPGRRDIIYIPQNLVSWVERISETFCLCNLSSGAGGTEHSQQAA